MALYVPGHTPADIAFKVEEHIFVGDTLFATDIGTARCDFPGGNAYQLYKSIMNFLIALKFIYATIIHRLIDHMNF